MYLLDRNLLVLELLSSHLHGEVSPGKEHRVPVEAPSRAALCGINAAFPRAGSATAPEGQAALGIPHQRLGQRRKAAEQHGERWWFGR